MAVLLDQSVTQTVITWTLIARLAKQLVGLVAKMAAFYAKVQGLILLLGNF